MRISDWSSDVCSSDLLPTPMSTCQQNLPIALYAYDPEGREIGGRPLGKLPRNHATLVDLEDLLDGAGSEWGHMELVYDFAAGGEADGWRHGLFRYEDKASRHVDERSSERRVGKECGSTCK